MIPDAFYYDASVRKLEYSKQAPGILRPERIFISDKIFQLERKTTARAPKTVILNNWLLSVWNERQKLNYQNILQEMLTSSPAFDVYLPRGGKLIKLTMENLASELAHTKDLDIHNNGALLRQGMHALGLPPERLYILDEHQPNLAPERGIVGSKEDRIWKLSNILRLSKVQQTQLLSNLSSLSPPLHTVWVDCYSTEAKKMLEVLQRHEVKSFNYYVGISDVEVASDPSDFFERAISLPGLEATSYMSYLENMSRFHLSGVHFSDVFASSESFGHLRDLSLTKVTVDDEESIQYFLSRQKTLQSLRLVNLESFHHETSALKYFDYKRLLRLELLFVNPSVSAVVITKLLQAAPNLEYLRFDVSPSRSEFLPVLQEFTHLRSLFCNISGLDNHIFQAIVARNPNLTDITILASNRLLSNTDGFEPRAWRQITSLALRKDIPLAILFDVLNAASLKHLHIVANFSEALSELELARTIPLETLHLNGKMASLTLEKILSKSPHLRELELFNNDIEDFSRDFVLDLRQLKIDTSKLNSSGLQKITRNNPNIARIELSDVSACEQECSWLASCHHLQMLKLKSTGFLGRTLTPDCLISLTTLDLEITSDIPFDSASLQNLLQASPKLAFLTLKNIKSSLAIDSGVSPLALEALQKLELLSSNLDQNLLSSIFQSSQSLRELSLVRSELSPSIERYEFASLERLMVADMKISGDQWGQMLSQAPALQELTIASTNCKDLSLTPGCLSSLKCLKITKIDENDLLVLLDAAPYLEALEISQPLPSISPRLRRRLDKIRFTESHEPDFSSKPSLLEDPRHDTEKYKSIDPEPREKTVEELADIDKTLSQGMVIHKLERYAQITSSYTDDIPKIKPGICYALSHLYQNSPTFFNVILTSLQSWDGSASSLSPEISRLMERVFASIYRYQYHQSSSYFLGENLKTHLATIEGCLIIGNPWHTIVVEKLGVDRFRIYDPNFVSGPQIIDEEGLLRKIHDCLGNLIAIEQPCPAVEISDPQKFLEHGGLLTLCHSLNFSEIIPFVQTGSWTPAALEGLFMRSNDGIPAWVFGILSIDANVVDLTVQMMQAYLEQNPKRGIEQFSKSLEHVKDFRLHQLMERLQKIFPDLLDEGLCSPEKSDFGIQASMFRSWQRQTTLSGYGEMGYVQACLSMDIPKQRLIECQNENVLMGLRYAISHYARHTSRPVFLVDSPDDLVCKTQSIALGKDGLGYLTPESRLSKFLHEHPDGVLIIDYQSFTADDIVRFNSMLDKSRTVDGVEIPDTVQIIGLNNTNNPKAYRQSDFYSRFSVVESCPIGEASLNLYIPPLPSEPTTADGDTLDLYHAQDFESLLLGRWVLNGDQLRFQEGQLISALKTGQHHLVLHNAPWDNPKFRRFWQDILHQGYLEHMGVTYPLPEALHLQFNDGYSWDKYRSRVDVITTMPAEYQLLNPSLLPMFFQSYQVFGDKLQSLPGFIEAASGKTLSVYVTRPIDEDAWAQIFDACERYDVHLELGLAPGVSLPDALQPKDALNFRLSSAGAEVIIVQDRDVLIPYFSQDAIIVDITECNVSDIFQKTTAEFRDGFLFSVQKSGLLQALESGSKVILTGKISPEMADHLSKLILQSNYQEQLQIIVEDSSVFDYVQSFGISAENELQYKLELLQGEFGEEYRPDPGLTYTSAFTLGTLGDTAYKGLASSHAAIRQPEPFDPDTSAEETSKFVAQRLGAVSDVLSKVPFVFLSGLSGVGKTQFVRHELASTGTLYEGPSCILDWVDDKSSKIKYLFIDEANLSNTEWSMFEGLYHIPPSIYFDGQYHPLTDQHRVVFAGNPLSYGDERHLPSLIARHGNSVWFDILPTAFIYEKVLKPMFADTTLAEHALEISQAILEVYRFLCAYSQTEVLISPRELQMMAALVLSNCREPAQLATVLAHVIYQVAKELVPQEGQKQFEQVFKPKQAWPYPDYPQMPDWVMTASREPYYQQLHNLLGLRAWRKADGRHSVQQIGGLGGMIIEGMPGLGKSEMVMAALRSLDYRELAPGQVATTDNIFYRLPVSWSIADKQQLLLEAFHQGAVVVIDEINSSPMMEQLLNALLMGHDLAGNPPAKPGFMVIGTQNPSFMAGRQQASTALSRRMLQVKLPAYTVDELIQILEHSDVRPRDARALAKAFYQASEEARVHQHTPAPTLRDLLQQAKPYQPTLIQQLEERITALTAELSTHRSGFFTDRSGVQGRIAGLKLILEALRIQNQTEIESTLTAFVSTYPRESPKLLAKLQTQYSPAAPYCGAGRGLGV